MKKLMILGAGIYQVPLIKKAKEMGLQTLVVSVPGEYPGFQYADRVFLLDTRDCEGIYQAAREEQIDGICTSGTDVAVVTIGYVCEKMGLPGIPCEAAQIVTDKALMKEAFQKKQVRAARYHKVFSAKEAEEAAQEIGFPVIVKRVDSSGSRGILKVSKREDVESAFREAVSGSRVPYVLVEEVLGGREIGVDGFVQDGKLVFLAPHEKFVYQGEKITVPMGHGFPLQEDVKTLEEISRQMQLAVEAAGMDQCPVNADVFVRDQKAWIVEIGGRTGATCIPELIGIHYGFDFYEKMIRNALGEPVSFEEREHTPCMAKLLVSPRGGKITDIDHEGIRKIREEGVEVQLDYPVGHSVSAMENGTDRIGHVIARTKREEELDEVIQRVEKCIEIDHRTLEELWGK